MPQPQALHFGFLIPVGRRDLESDDNVRQERAGGYGFAVNDTGQEAIYRYFQNRDSAANNFQQGWLISSVGDTQGRTVGTGSTFTTTSISATGLLALNTSQHVGSLCLIITDGTASAGSAPNGQMSVVISNTSARIGLDPGRPFTVAPTQSAVFHLIGQWNCEDSTGDTNIAVYGFVVAQNGVSNNNFGWAQRWGLVPQALYNSQSANIGSPLVAATVEAACTAGRVSAYFFTIIGYSPTSQVTLSSSTRLGPAVVQLGFGLSPLATAAGNLV